ncbi:hypothetical protein J4Q44_G00359370 [Coregonus suidteri]|uniref:Uncharacterized protein n=1 Tax=Coregonus suidteri TaxID=861788 RepID=A0AAN8KRF6_9TELE
MTLDSIQSKGTGGAVGTKGPGDWEIMHMGKWNMTAVSGVTAEPLSEPRRDGIGQEDNKAAPAQWSMHTKKAATDLYSWPRERKREKEEEEE